MTDPRKLADEFVNGLKTAVGDRMRSAALFGSAARGEWIDGMSDVNVLVLVDEIDTGLLGRASGVARESVPKGVMPLMMEAAEWQRASDVFAIELADMKDAHVPLHGDDPVAHFEAAPGVLRLQAERELRGKLLHLHSGMLLAAYDRTRLGQLLLHSLPSFVTYMRAALRLDGRHVPIPTPEVIAEGCRLAGADGDPFLRVHQARTDGGKLELSLSDSLAQNFNASAQKLADYIDAHGR